MDIVLVAPDALRSVWNFVREGLAEMPAEDWIAEDVYHAIRSGNAALHLAIDDTGPVGFLVLVRRTAEFSGVPILHVWLAYSKADKDAFTAGEKVIRETARRMGAHKITFGSPRMGWAKRYPLVSATYEIPMESA